MTNRAANIGFSLVVIIACIVFAQMALQFENPGALAGAQVPTEVFPLMMLGFTALCALINIVNFLRGDPEGDADRPFDFRPAVAMRVISIVALLLICVFLWDWIGFIPMSVVLLLGIAAIMQVRSPVAYIFLAAFGPLVWAAFNFGVGTPL
ncbi:tripartite tricarboxylate transporter TctB family protein [Phaeobacter sp. J2-8]|uniref:tripartite tricarboxylate transporter TctB family protein n=1 Tax=Phaeobacter sp. J2-8 TaxID=2931394 RepID=UPI001FCFDA84|nr:tripartite tricarboxylate transporter TctB family protein [Phaeobacter sp. J2-8]MCJ7873265.1 tripartite tricarboxylate transporter TctB family protein [Phaeobacter sp. J2-8]